jgi:hypothetical protein
MGCGLSGFVQVGGEERVREEKQENKIYKKQLLLPLLHVQGKKNSAISKWHHSVILSSSFFFEKKK